MSNTGKWTWASEYADRWENALYDTREKAVQAGITQAKIDGVDRFEIGRCQNYQVPSLNAFLILDRIEDEFADEAATEAVYDWRRGISGDHEKLLDKMLNEALQKWLDITDNHPKSCEIVDIEKINVVDEEGE